MDKIEEILHSNLKPKEKQTEITKHNPKVQKELILRMKEIIKKENNNGVKNVYLKALKNIEK